MSVEVTEEYTRSIIMFKSEPYTSVSSPVYSLPYWLVNDFPPPWNGIPDTERIKSDVQPTVNQAIGQFIQTVLDGGYYIAIKGVSVGVSYEVLNEKYVELIPPLGNGWYKFQRLRTVVSVVIDYNTTPSVWQSPIAPIMIIAIAVAVAIIIGGVGIYFALQNLTKETETHEQHYVLVNNTDEPQTWTLADGRTVTVPPHSFMDFTEKTEITKPPDYWGYVIPIIVIVGVIGGAAIIAPNAMDYFREERRRSEYLPPPPPPSE